VWQVKFSPFIRYNLVGFDLDRLFIELSTSRVLVVPHTYTTRLA